jgi:UDP-N-acetylenolpyruvoylglucosamine reductase
LEPNSSNIFKNPKNLSAGRLIDDYILKGISMGESSIPGIIRSLKVVILFNHKEEYDDIIKLSKFSLFGDGNQIIEEKEFRS